MKTKLKMVEIVCSRGNKGGNTFRTVLFIDELRATEYKNLVCSFANRRIYKLSYLSFVIMSIGYEGIN